MFGESGQRLKRRRRRGVREKVRKKGEARRMVRISNKPGRE